MTFAGQVHGYGAYTRGCRCETCTAAKAEYMRKKRAADPSVNAKDLSRARQRRAVTKAERFYDDAIAAHRAAKARYATAARDMKAGTPSIAQGMDHARLSLSEEPIHGRHRRRGMGDD
jgi:hypothetical protein